MVLYEKGGPNYPFWQTFPLGWTWRSGDRRRGENLVSTWENHFLLNFHKKFVHSIFLTFIQQEFLDPLVDKRVPVNSPLIRFGRRPADSAPLIRWGIDFSKWKIYEIDKQNMLFEVWQKGSSVNRPADSLWQKCTIPANKLTKCPFEQQKLRSTIQWISQFIRGKTERSQNTQMMRNKHYEQCMRLIGELIARRGRGGQRNNHNFWSQYIKEENRNSKKNGPLFPLIYICRFHT